MPELTGLLIFDRSGALLGGGCIGMNPAGQQEITNRWALGIIDYDWAERFKLDEPEVLAEVVPQGVVIMLQATIVELGKIWGENEAKWIGRLEGAMSALDRLGISHGQKAAGKHDGKSDFVAPRG